MCLCFVIEWFTLEFETKSENHCSAFYSRNSRIINRIIMYDGVAGATSEKSSSETAPELALLEVELQNASTFS